MLFLFGLNLVTHTEIGLNVDMTLTNAVNMPGADLRRPLAGSLSKSPGKKPEVDGVLHHETWPKLAVKFHVLTRPFDLLLLVSFHEDG